MKTTRYTELEQTIEKLKEQIQQLQKEKTILENLSIHDNLTGVYNRRPLEDLVKKQIARFKRYRENFAILLIDGDNFKQINDNYGHQIGDQYLIILTNLIRKNLRETDWIIRYGGEEFIVLLQDTEVEEAILLSERLNKVISEYKMFPTNDPDKFINWSISIGISMMKKGDTNDSLLERVDKALYHAKKCGKNCTALADIDELGTYHLKTVSSDKDIIWN